MAKYFFRLDDIAPKMNWENFYLLRELFGKYGIKPLFAVIPDVKDPKLTIWPEEDNFWAIMKELIKEGWVLAQHGYNHLSLGNGGILNIHNSGEFGGLDFGAQKSMINSGKEIIEANLGTPEIFVAPRHSFDRNTLAALSQSGFRYISDGIALYPFKKGGLIWLPQISWRPRSFPFGLITFALHLNTMTKNDFEELEKFMGNNRENLGKFSDLVGWHDKTGLIKKISAGLMNIGFKFAWIIVFKIKHGLSK